MRLAFPYLLLPHLWSSRNRARRRERGDLTRSLVFGSIGVVVCGTLFGGAYWLTAELLEYAEFGDYLLRLGLSWLFLTFLAFLAFSGVVTALSTFFLSDELRVLMAAPIAPRRLFHARFARTVGQASWMVVIFLTPVLLGIGAARCAPPLYYITAVLTVVPFSMIPVALGTAATLVLVNVLPARRARDIMMLAGLAFAAALVLLLRFIRPEQLLRVESLPDVTDFFATLQSPVTPMLPSFWAGESLFASLQGGLDWLHAGALWSTALACTVVVGAANERWHFAGYSRSQEAPKSRFKQFLLLDRLVVFLPFSTVRRQLLLKDVKTFLRDVSQILQLLPLLALVLLYLYNFRVLDLDRIPYMTEFVTNVYAFVNLGMAGFVMATVAVRFVLPAVSAEGGAFWLIRSSPISMHDFLWSKFWTGLFPVFLLTEALTVAANELLGIDPFLRVLTAAAAWLRRRRGRRRGSASGCRARPRPRPPRRRTPRPRPRRR
jgi:ABC-2 type transport system permease protein